MNSLVQALSRLQGVTSTEGALAILSDQCMALGARRFAYLIHLPGTGGAMVERLFVGGDAPWCERLSCDGERACMHRLLSLCLHKMTPSLMPADACEQHGARLRQQPVCFPTHRGLGDAGVLSITFDTATAAQIETLMPHGQLIACFVHEAMLRLVSAASFSPVEPLTRRELECLQWVARDKTSWEIAQILGVTEHAIIYHIRNLTRKLDVSSRYQAVLRAASLGLIHF